MSETSPSATSQERYTQTFYNRQYEAQEYAAAPEPSVVQLLGDFVRRFNLNSQAVLEVGCGRGLYQDVVENWTGVDLAESVRPLLRKPFVCAPAQRIPLPDSSFDAIWSIFVLEHVDELEAALQEICRLLRSGGVALLMPAWFCRSWAASGIQVRPWRDLTWRERLAKATIPVRNSLLFRLIPVAVQRTWREFEHAVTRAPTRLHHARLQANYDVFWQPDSDACNSLDPHDLALWFASRGWQVYDRETLFARLTIRGGAVIVQKPKD